MKHSLLAIAASLVAPLALHAADDGHHHDKVEAGPNGGRLITTIEPHAEFLVTPDRRVQITFVSDDGSTVAPGQYLVTVTTGQRSAPVTLTFTASGNALLSDTPLPDGNNLPVVVQFKSAPDTKATVEKFTLNLSTCPECQRPEYACTCTHAH